MGIFKPSANTVERSACPSPFVSVSSIILSFGISPGLRCGYVQVQATYILPLESHLIVNGFSTPSFSEAKRFTSKPSAGRNSFNSCLGEIAEVGGGRGICFAIFGLVMPLATAATFFSAAAIKSGI